MSSHFGYFVDDENHLHKMVREDDKLFMYYWCLKVLLNMFCIKHIKHWVLMVLMGLFNAYIFGKI